MPRYKDFFAGKKVTLMGLGLLGRGVGDARFLAECGAELIVTDLKTRDQLADSLAQLKEFSNITYVLGEHRLEDFRDGDMVIKAAGVPLNSPYIKEAKKNKIPVRMSADLFAELSGVPIIGITGTRGKSTVTHLIAHILKSAGKNVLLGGNVRGVSNLELLTHVLPESVAVLELDSWQLQGFGDARLSPHVSVFTTFMPDHMNYYGNDMKKYFADKANIFLNQKEDDVLVLGGQVAPFIKEFGYQNKIRSHVEVVRTDGIPQSWKLRIIGEHNRYNAALAAAAARALGVDEEDIKKGTESFEGVPGRLQFVKEVRGVKIYNDNNATTPEATIAALKSFEQPVVLIAGGADKNLNLSELIKEIQKCKKVLLLAGTGTDRLQKDLSGAEVYHTMQDAVKNAVSAAGMGDVILFSPAFASFGMFKNEYERNDIFMDAVNKIV